MSEFSIKTEGIEAEIKCQFGKDGDYDLMLGIKGAMAKSKEIERMIVFATLQHLIETDALDSTIESFKMSRKVGDLTKKLEAFVNGLS